MADETNDDGMRSLSYFKTVSEIEARLKLNKNKDVPKIPPVQGEDFAKKRRQWRNN